MTTDLLQRGKVQTGYRLSTASQSFDRVRRGEDPWIAFGDFLDDWRRAERDQRPMLMVDPIRITKQDPLRRWAALFAATIDWLCWKSEPQLAAPAWVARDVYTLPKPWFVIESDALRAWQLAESPAPFRMRRVYTDSSIVSRA